MIGVLVTGGSGTLGRAVVRRLLAGGRPDKPNEVRALSRRPRTASGGETWRPAI